MNSAKFNNWHNTKEEEELVMKYEYIKEAKVNEDTSFVPRFSLKKYQQSKKSITFHNSGFEQLYDVYGDKEFAHSVLTDDVINALQKITRST